MVPICLQELVLNCYNCSQTYVGHFIYNLYQHIGLNNKLLDRTIGKNIKTLIFGQSMFIVCLTIYCEGKCSISHYLFNDIHSIEEVQLAIATFICPVKIHLCEIIDVLRYNKLIISVIDASSSSVVTHEEKITSEFSFNRITKQSSPCLNEFGHICVEIRAIVKKVRC